MGLESINPKKVYYEEKLWARAEELSRERESLTTESNEIFSRVQTGNVDAIGLQAKDEINRLQGYYFDLFSKNSKNKRDRRRNTNRLSRN